MYEQQQTTKKENKGEVDFFQLKEMMKRFSQMHKNYHIEENKSPAFRHIQILIHEGSWAIVSTLR